MKNTDMVNALALVAHPDDETIWMGGTILRNNKWDWTIFSLCRKSDPDRMPKFKRVCGFYNALPIIADLDDEKLNPLNKAEIVNSISGNLDQKSFDYVFAHGENGEYGHIRHRELHRAAKSMLHDDKLRCRKALFFSYQNSSNKSTGNPHKKIPRAEIPVPRQNSGYFTKLSDEELQIKRDVITKMYGFKEGSFEALSCSKIEAFEVHEGGM